MLIYFAPAKAAAAPNKKVAMCFEFTLMLVIFSVILQLSLQIDFTI
jgi:hypothetical protein